MGVNLKVTSHHSLPVSCSFIKKTLTVNNNLHPFLTALSATGTRKMSSGNVLIYNSMCLNINIKQYCFEIWPEVLQSGEPQVPVGEHKIKFSKQLG